MRTEFGYTALHWCVAGSAGSRSSKNKDKHKQIAKALISAGIDTSIVTFRGKTAWDLALQMNEATVLAVFDEFAWRASL